MPEIERPWGNIDGVDPDAPLKAARISIRETADGYEVDIHVVGDLNQRMLRRAVQAELRRLTREQRDLPPPDPGQVADVLALVSLNVAECRALALARIAEWSARQRFSAMRWALAEHAYAYHGRLHLCVPQPPYVCALETEARDALEIRGETR